MKRENALCARSYGPARLREESRGGPRRHCPGQGDRVRCSPRDGVATRVPPASHSRRRRRFERLLDSGEECLQCARGEGFAPAYEHRVHDRFRCRCALERFGRVDILVNNASRGMKYVRETFMTESTRFWEVEPDTWRMVIDTNVNGPFLMAHAVAPHLIRAGWGRIINVSVSHSTMRRPGFSPYGPSKAALESETVIWAQDLRGTGVTVNTLLPGGATLTGMIPDAFPANARGTMLDPGIMVPPLLWLVSQDTNAITGCRVTANQWDDGNPLAAAESAGWGSEPTAT